MLQVANYEQDSKYQTKAVNVTNDANPSQLSSMNLQVESWPAPISARDQADLKLVETEPAQVHMACTLQAIAIAVRRYTPRQPDAMQVVLSRSFVQV